jgi:REP-associated tyrosine transposase
VFARGNAKQLIFLDDPDRRMYLRMLRWVVKRVRWRCLAYCLMNNHVHLLIETPHANLGSGMQRLHGLYAQTFNDHHGRRGHLFQGRYGSVRMLSDEQLWTTVAYIAINPAAAGLCERPRDWPWSSHAGVTASAFPRWLDVPRLLSFFEGLGPDPRSRYERAVDDAWQGKREALQARGRMLFTEST